jgi:hypothetical protein
MYEQSLLRRDDPLIADMKTRGQELYWFFSVEAVEPAMQHLYSNSEKMF